MKIGKNNSTDALLLAFVRILTLAIGLLSTSILSHQLELVHFGTYAAGNLIVSTATIFTAFGLVDAANYYYHHKERNQDYVNTVFAIQAAIGVVCAVVLAAGKPWIIRYFKNDQLYRVFGLLLFRPLLSNLESMLLVLQTAVGRARAVAIRNIVFSSAKLGAVLLTAFVFQDVRAMFVAFLLLDLLTIGYYARGFSKEAFPIRIHKACPELVRQILTFSVPMGIYLLAGEIMKDIDKYVIAAFESPQMLAVYTNSAAPLPITFLSTAFLTVSIPIITRLVRASELRRASDLYRAYLKIGYITSGTLTMICIILASEMVLLLYGADYLAGIHVFRIYLLVDMVKFAGVTLVLTAFGRTKLLMVLSCIATGLNLVLNPIFYALYGMEGPAIATLLITCAIVCAVLYFSAASLGCGLGQLFKPKACMWYLLELGGVSLGAWLLRRTLVKLLPGYVVILLIGALAAGTILLLQWNQLRLAMGQINREKNSE